MSLIEIGWVISDPDGFKFLQKLSITQNMELFELDYLKILIEYLYQRFKNKILSIRLTFYLIKVVLYGATVFYHERRFIRLQEEKKEQLKNLAYVYDWQILDRAQMVVAWLNLIVTLFLLLSILNQAI